MMKTLLSLSLLLLVIVRVYSVGKKHYKKHYKKHHSKHQIQMQARFNVLRRLLSLQNAVFYPQFKKKEQIELKSFREEQDKKILAYYGSLYLGNQHGKFNVLFDSGSTNVFLMSTQCHDMACNNHRLYDLQKAKEVVQQQNSIQYICGKSDGVLVKDNIQMNKQENSLKVVDQMVHVGNTVQIPAFINSRWDGIVGLGYFPSFDKQELAAVDPIKLSIIDNIVVQNLMPDDKQYFTYSLKNQQGSLIFGEMSTKIDQNQIVWVDVDRKQVNEEVSWILKLKDVFLIHTNTIQRMQKKETIKGNQNHSVKQQKPIQKYILKSIDKMRFRDKNSRKSDLCPNGCKLLIDTGTYLNYIPNSMFKQIMGKFDFRSNFCNNMDKHPDIKFIFDNGKEIVLKPQQYIEMYQIDQEKICTNSFTPDDIEVDIITLGQMFLKTFHTIFDFGNKRIGFQSNLNDIEQSK